MSIHWNENIISININDRLTICFDYKQFIFFILFAKDKYYDFDIALNDDPKYKLVKLNDNSENNYDGMFM